MKSQEIATKCEELMNLALKLRTFFPSVKFSLENYGPVAEEFIRTIPESPEALRGIFMHAIHVASDQHSFLTEGVSRSVRDLEMSRAMGMSLEVVASHFTNTVVTMAMLVETPMFKVLAKSDGMEVE